MYAVLVLYALSLTPEGSMSTERKDLKIFFLSSCGPRGSSGGTVRHGQTDERPTVKGLVASSG